MKLKAPETLSTTEKFAFYEVEENIKQYLYGTRGGWIKDKDNPIFGDGYGVCFDMSIIRESGKFRMWFSWRSNVCIGYCESSDGKHWSEPEIVLHPRDGYDPLVDEFNRPSVIKIGKTYKMWYSSQKLPYREEGTSVIALAESEDGIKWTHPVPSSVLSPDQEWEEHAVMCPHVLYDQDEQVYKMWYSAGSNHEPDAIGYAVSKDGITWEKNRNNPVFERDQNVIWEQYKVLGSHVLKHGEYYYMFYIGHMHEERASIGIARSEDGISHWERYSSNPIISPDPGTWDGMSIYKPFVMKHNGKWMLWYNGAKFDPRIWADEKIGLAYLDHENFGFDD